jgi:hypothetical protein
MKSRAKPLLKYLRSLYYQERYQHLCQLTLLCGGIYLLVALLYVQSGTSPLGDEPHYLVITQTLLKYHSLDVMQDYRHRDYRQFYPQILAPHVTHNAYGQLLPLHSIGGPLLWLLPFFLLGRLGVTLFIAIVSTLTILNIYRLLVILHISRKIAYSVCIAYAFASPLAIYAHLVFIEPIATLICVYIVRVCLEDVQQPYDLVLCSLLLGILPWVHSRFALLELPLFFGLLYKLYRYYKLQRPSYYVYYLLPVTLLFIALEAYSLLVWGTLNPAANQLYSGSTPFEVSPFRGIVGVFFDQEHGFLLSFTLFFFMLSGIILAVQRRLLFYNVLVLALSAPYILAFTSFRHWSGGLCPPARFMLVLLPLYAFYIAYVLDRAQHIIVYSLFRLIVWWGCFYNVLALLSITRYGFNTERGHNQTLYPLRIANFNPAMYFPSVFRHHQTTLFVAWLSVYLAITGLLVLLARLEAVSTRFDHSNEPKKDRNE